jgi:WhiB family redox-sensing transcriptional regulator
LAIQDRSARDDFGHRAGTDLFESASSVGRGVRAGVPDDWHIDPVLLGVPGVRKPETDEDSQLAWQVDSLCAQTDPEAFFPEKGGSTRDAKKICASCDVRAQCLEYALQNDERFGIWGGLSERERRKLRRRA